MIITKEFYDETKPNALFDIHGTLILEMLYQQELGKNIVIWTCGTDEEVKEAVAVIESLPEKIKISKIDNETKSMLYHPESVLYDDKTINPLKWEIIPIDVDMPKEEDKEEIIPTSEGELTIDIEKPVVSTEKEIIKEEIKKEIKEEIKKEISKLETEIKEIKEIIKKEETFTNELL